jgi:hypothetical protein
LINSTNQISQICISGLSTTLSNYQTKISLTNTIDWACVSTGAGTMAEWFDNYYNRFEIDGFFSFKQNLISSTNQISQNYISGLSTTLSNKQNLISSTNKLDVSLINGLINGSTTMLSSFIYTNPTMRLDTYLDLNFGNIASNYQLKINSNKLLPASYITGLSGLSSSSASTTMLSNLVFMSSDIAQGMSLNVYLEQKQAKITLGNPLDSSLIKFGQGTLGEWFDNYYNKTDINSLLSNKQTLINVNNKLNGDYVVINGLTLPNYFLGFQGLISNYNNTME